MEERLTRLQAKLEADPSLGEKLFSLETAEEVQSFLRGLELEFSLEEINELRDVLVKALEKTQNGELSDEDLEDVAGGLIITLIGLGIMALAFGACVTSGVMISDHYTQGKW